MDLSILEEAYHGVQEVNVPLSENPNYATAQSTSHLSNSNQFSTNSTAFAEMHATPYRNFGAAAPLCPSCSAAHSTNNTGEGGGVRTILDL